MSQQGLEDNASGGSNSKNPAPQKRNRSQLSCAYCRQAKLKCDRSHPCGQCVRRNKASSCSFPPPAPRKRPPMSMQRRLIHLESLVKNVMSGQSSTESSPAGKPGTIDGNFDQITVPQIAEEPCDDASHEQLQLMPESAVDESPNVTSGQVLLSEKEATYVGATHWAAILEDIEEIKSYCNAEESDETESPDSVDEAAASLLFNSGIPATREEILAFLPPRQVVDRHVSRYFNSTSPALHITHRPAFQRQYKKFWADQNSTPIVWVAILYGIMCLSAYGSVTAGQEPLDSRGSPDEIIRSYRACCAQSLVLSDYVRPGAHTLEAFILYAEIEFIISKHDQVSSYLFIGNAVRLAFRMGLHRDPSKVGGSISPFQGEMRRRMWQVVTQIDLLASFHIGLPSMVQAVESDTLEPRNLFDTDFDEDSTELPPSRPKEERTHLSYTLAKGRVARVFGQIVSHANRLSPPDYEEVMTLDRLLNEAYSHVPSFLRVRPMEQSVIDPPELIIQRTSICLLYNKSRCVLHRTYILMDNEDAKYKLSHDAGLDASFSLLLIQSEMHDAIQGSGILSRHSWFNSSMSGHDFLLAAMILYINIDHMKRQYAQTKQIRDSEKYQFTRMMRALQRSHHIWSETKAISPDARKSYEVLDAMMKKVTPGSQAFAFLGDSRIAQGYPEQPVNGNGDSATSGLSFSDFTAPLPQPAYGEIGLGSVSKISPDSTTRSSGQSIEYDAPDIGTAWASTEPLGSMLEIPSDFDWQSFDNQVRFPPPPTSYPYQPFGTDDYHHNFDDPNYLE